MGKKIACVKSCATSANLGPGFDRAGLALDVFNCYVVFENDKKGAPEERSLVRAALESTLDHCKVRKRQPLIIESDRNIPRGRGLGSSAADILAGILIGNRVYGLGLSGKEIFDIALSIEKHPDNIAAAISGGLAVCYRRGSGFFYDNIDIYPHIKVLLFIPGQTVNTIEARKAIPTRVPVEDAIENSAHLCLFVDRLKKGDLTDASLFIKDNLYQEYRRKIYPASMEIVDRLLEHGIPAAISGSGPSVIAFLKEESQIGHIWKNFTGFELLRTKINFKGTFYVE